MMKRFIKGLYKPNYPCVLSRYFTNFSKLRKMKILSEDFIVDFADDLDWFYLSEEQPLSEDFIRRFQDKVNWHNISESQKLSEDFIREFKEKVDWYYISMYQKLSEDFMREFQDEIHWHYACKHQKMSVDFMREFKDNMLWDYVSKYQNLSESFKLEFSNFLFKRMLNPQNNWLYRSVYSKRQHLLDYYELDGDYIIAYKTTRKNGYSVFNFQHRYEVGKEYEAHCDFNADNEASFGLSAWTRENALRYHSRGDLYEVRIHLDDAVKVDSYHKIRCSKFTVVRKLKIKRRERKASD